MNKTFTSLTEKVLQDNHVSYGFYTKPLKTSAQQKKFLGMCQKKNKYVFIVIYSEKSKGYLCSLVSEDNNPEETLVCVCFRGPHHYFIYNDIEEEILKNELYDEIVTCGTPKICMVCQEQIRTQTITCVSCKEAKLCSFCFTKRILVENRIQCDYCSEPFIQTDTKTFIDEMVETYKQNPRDLMTALQKKKKHLPPGLKNLSNIVRSAISESKQRGDPLPLGNINPNI
jgi:hypothetical protein